MSWSDPEFHHPNKPRCERCGTTSYRYAKRWLVWGGGRVGLCEKCWVDLGLDEGPHIEFPEISNCAACTAPECDEDKDCSRG